MSHSLPPRSERTSQAADLPEAIASALKELRKNLADDSLWENLDEACRDEDRPEEGAAFYSEVMDSDEPAEVRVKVGMRAADFCEEWFEDTEPVVEMLTRVLEIDPRHDEAFQRLTVLLTVSSRWSELLDVYDTAIAKEDDSSRRAALLEEAAKVARDFASEAQKGSDYLKQLLLLRIDDDQLAAAVERRLDEQQRHADLVEVWKARLEVLDSEAALRTRVSIASRYLEPMGDGVSFLSILDEFLEAGGSKQQACSLLSDASRSARLEPEIKRAALRRLETIEEEEGNTNQVVVALERLLELSEANQERIALHDKVSRLLADIGRKPEALAHAVRVMVLDPDLDDARQRSRALAFEVDGVADYADALVRAGEAADDDSRRLELFIEAAGLLSGELAHNDGAAQLYVRLFEDEAADEAVKLLATQELSRLLEALGDHERLLHYLCERADLETKADQRREVLGRAAELAERLGHVDRALELWALRLADDKEDFEALSARIRLFDQSQQHQGLVQSLVARCRLGDDEDRQRQDLVWAASVYADGLRDLSAALETWRGVEKRFGRNAETDDQLVALSIRAERFDDAESVLRESIDSARTRGEDEGRLVAKLIQAGDIRRVHLDRFEDAIAAYDEALGLSPFDERAREGLLTMTQVEECAHQAAETLAAALHRAQDYQVLVALLERRLQVAPDDEFRAKVLIEAAELQEQAGDAHAALDSLRRSFALHPLATTEEQLHRLAAENEGWEVVVEAYTQAIARLDDDRRDTERRLYFRRGRVEEQFLFATGRAADSFRVALETEPTDVDAAMALIRAAHTTPAFEQAAHGLVLHSLATGQLAPDIVAHYEQCAARHGRWDEALEGLADEIARSDLPDRLGHDLKRQLAIWHRDAAGDPDSAELVLRRAVADYPQENTLRMLAELQRRAPGKPLVLTLLALADATDGELAALHEAGEVALFKVVDTEMAEPILERAFTEAKKRFLAAHEAAAESTEEEAERVLAAAEELEGIPSTRENPRAEAERVCAWAVDHLVDLALGRQEHDHAVELLEESSALPFREQERLGRRFRAAEVAAVGGFDERAVRLGESVLESEPSHEGAIRLLSSLHEKAGRLDQLLALRRRELALDRPIERRLFLRLDQSRVLGELADESSARIEVLRENLQDSPGHAETVQALAELLEAEESYEALAEMLETQAEAIAGARPRDAAQFWERAGRVVELRLDDVERLRRDFKQAVVAHPSLPVLDRLAELSRQAEEWGSEVAWLEQRLSLTAPPGGDGYVQGDRRQVVELLGTALMRSEELQQARELLETELAGDPAADGIRKLLADLYSTLEEWQELATLLADGVEFAPDHAGSVEYLRAAATVERRRLSNLSGAIPLLEQAIALDDTDRSLRLQLADCLGEAEQYQPAREILTKLLEEFGRRRSKERAHVHKQLARIARAMGELDEALAQAEEAAKIERTSPAILMLLGQLARGKGELDRAEQAYRTLALIVSRQGTPENIDDSEMVGESAILFELYQIAQERSHEEQAKELLDSALEVATRSQEESLRLADSLVSLGKLELLLDALELQLSRGVEGAARARLLVTRATVLEKNERPDLAFEARLEALSVTPSDGKLIDSTRKLAARIDEEERFWTHLEQLAASREEQPSISGELWLRLGKHAEQQEDWERASQLYERAQRTGHKPRRTFLSLDRSLGHLDAADRQLLALRRFVETPGVHDDPGTLSDALYRLARFELSGEDETVQEPVDPSILQRQGLEHLSQALEIDRDDARALELLRPVASSDAVKSIAAPMFLRLARSAGDQSTQLQAFCDVASLPEPDIDEVKEGVELARSLGAGPPLRQLLTRVIELAHGQDDLSLAQDALVERANLAEEDGELSLMVELLGQAAPLLPLEEAREVYIRIAECQAGPLQRPDQAIASYERLLGDIPEQRNIWHPLLALYRAAGRDDAAAECISLVEGHVDSDEDLLVLHMERIRLMIAADRLDEAEEQLKKAIDRYPDSAEAADVLVDLLRKTDRTDELREVLENLFDKARSREDADMVARYGLELAALVGEQDRREAISILTAGLGQTSRNRQVLTTLLGLLGEEDEPSERADVLEHLLALESGDAARRVAHELIAIREAENDEFGLGRALELGFQASPNDEEIVGRFIDHLRLQQDYGRLADTLTYRAEHSPDVTQALGFLVEAGRLLRENLGEPLRAAHVLSRAFALQPSDPELLGQACECYVLAGEVPQALELLGATIDRADEMVLPDALDRRAKILAEELGGSLDVLQQAAQDLKRAREHLLPEDQELDIQRRLVDVLDRLRQAYAEADETDAGRRTVVDLAELLVEQGEPTAGTQTLADWLRDYPGDMAAAAELGRLADRVGDFSTAIFAYSQLVQGVEGDARRDAVLALSDAAMQAGDPMAARQQLEELFSQRPDETEIRDRLRAMYENAGEFEQLANVLLAEADRSEEPPARYQLYLEVGDLLLRSGESARACEAYEQALSVAPEPYLVTTKLADAYIGMGDVERAKAVLDDAVAEHGKRRSPELGVLQHAMARVAEASGDVDGMFTWLEAALMSDRNNGEVACELAVRAQDSGRFDVAIKALQILTLAKTEAPISKAEAYYRQAVIAVEQGDTKKGLLLVRRAVSADGTFEPAQELAAQLGA